jgi:hypothetical protein
VLQTRWIFLVRHPAVAPQKKLQAGKVRQVKAIKQIESMMCPCLSAKILPEKKR